jgi:cytochrome c oxidase assembly protein subunit 15
METRDARLRKIRNLALLLTALSFLILLVSAYIRLNGAGLDCSPWPHCYGQLLVGGPYKHSDAARILHRVVASSALLLGFALAWQCQRPQPIQPPVRYATALLVLMILLTFVGIWSADPHRAWASFFNILGGAGLVLLSWRTVLATGTQQAPTPHRRPAALLHAGLGTLALTMALGALIGARYAATACPFLPGCIDASWPAAAGWSALNPFTRVAVAASMGDDGGVALHLLHRYCAVAALLLLGYGSLRALAQPATRPSAALLLALLLVQFALGVLTILSGLSLHLAIAHSVCAAALLAAGMQLLIRVKAAPG